MGNVIAAPDRTVETSKIADLINKWALESYDDGLNYGKNKPLISNNQLLKKRACCTNQESMPIAFPTLVQDNKNYNNYIGIVAADTTASIVLDNNGQPLGLPAILYNVPHTNVLVRIFNDTNNLENKCIFDTDNKTTTNYAVDVSPQGGWKFHTEACSNLYHGINDRTGDSFCKHVRDDRSKVYNLDSKIAYGPTNYNIDNSYLDCNCENSLLRKAQDQIAFYDKDNQKPIHTIDTDMMVQLLDQKCEEVSSFSKIYKKNVQNLCINLADLRNINIQDKSILNTNQTCGTTGIPSNQGPPISIPTLPTPVIPPTPLD